MNEKDLRDLYTEHEPLVAAATDRLLPGVRARHHRYKIKSRFGYGLTAVAVAVLATGVTLLVRHAAPGSGPTAHPLGPPSARMESSLGMQIYVPAIWRVNDTGCGQDDQPSVNRGTGRYGSPALCLTPTPPDKEWATISDTDAVKASVDAKGRLPVTDTTIDGVAVRRASGPIGNGMYGGWLDAPSRQVHLAVRARTSATVDAILASVHLRDVDPFGCGLRPVDLPGARHGDDFVDPHPESITVCDYSLGAASRLQSATIRTGAAAAQLAAILNSAQPGDNPDVPEAQCLWSTYPDHIDATVQVRSADGSTGKVTVTWQVCKGAHLDNGSTHRQVTNDTIMAIMASGSSGG